MFTRIVFYFIKNIKIQEYSWICKCLSAIPISLTSQVLASFFAATWQTASKLLQF